MVKPGVIVGLIFGIIFMAFPTIGFMTNEASLSNSQGQIIGIGFIVFGAIMFIVNVLCLIKGTDNLFASSDNMPNNPSSARIEKNSEINSNTNEIRCRFCKKLYSSEYNGCPHCKKK